MKSEFFNFRLSPVVRKEMEVVLKPGETKAGFVLQAIRGELSRRSLSVGRDRTVLELRRAIDEASTLLTALEKARTNKPVERVRLHNGRTKEDLRIHVISAGVRPLDNRICDVVGNDGAAWLLSCMGTYRELCLKNPYSWPTFRELVDAHPNGHDVFKRWPELRGMYEEDAAEM